MSPLGADHGLSHSKSPIICMCHFSSVLYPHKTILFTFTCISNTICTYNYCKFILDAVLLLKLLPQHNHQMTPRNRPTNPELTVEKPNHFQLVVAVSAPPCYRTGTAAPYWNAAGQRTFYPSRCRYANRVLVMNNACRFDYAFSCFPSLKWYYGWLFAGLRTWARKSFQELADDVEDPEFEAHNPSRVR